MGDFFIDFRPPEQRQTAAAARLLKFYEDMHVEIFNDPRCSVVLTSADDSRLWASHASPDGTLWVGLCGRVALDSRDWTKAETQEGEGGLACKFIGSSYRNMGLKSFGNLNGNFVVLLLDRKAGTFFIVTDRWGLSPAFRFGGGPTAVYSSHPDVLADMADQGKNWDLTSFAEFILTGRLSYPFTYYRRIEALPFASVTTIRLHDHEAVNESIQPYFEFQFAPEPMDRLDALTEEFAEALRNSVSKRTLKLTGKSAVALSGGLDSRTVLCAAPNVRELIAVSCYEEENREFLIARAIARAAGATLVPLRRSFDYYGHHASMGVRISAGMGCIASNHFLGFRDELRELGVVNLLTGCYCDYLYKGLALNKRINTWTTRERTGSFSFSYYAKHLDSNTKLAAAVRDRLVAQFPAESRRYDSETAVLDIERRRVFPLSYEEDNAERVIPQRVMGWYVPIADNDLMQVYLKMSCAMRCNRTLFIRVAERVCGPEVARIPDANTGAPVNACLFREALSSHLHRLGRLYRRLRRTSGTADSWPNWGYYVRESRLIKTQWSSPNDIAAEVFRLVLGKDGVSNRVEDYGGKRLAVFLQLLTLKIWFDQRAK